MWFNSGPPTGVTRLSIASLERHMSTDMSNGTGAAVKQGNSGVREVAGLVGQGNNKTVCNTSKRKHNHHQRSVDDSDPVDFAATADSAISNKEQDSSFARIA